MKRHLQSNYQKITPTAINRISKLQQQGLLDILAQRIVWPQGSAAPLASGSAAYFPNGFEIEFDSGDRGTGAVLHLTAGFGFKNATEADPDEVAVKPIINLAQTTTGLTLAASDPTNPRIDSIFTRPQLTAKNPQSVDVIDNSTLNVAPQSLNQDEEWGYELTVVTGTPNASPVAPGPPAGWVEADRIYDVTVNAGSGTILAVNIADQRTTLEIATGLAPATTGLAASAISLSPAINGQTNVQGSNADLDSRITNVSTTGVLHGEFQYVNTSSVRLARTLRQQIVADIDGTILVHTGSDITFDITLHLETPQTEAASTWYYCYLENAGGTLTPHMSSTAPMTDGTSGKAGYHPTQLGWRYVGSVRNNASSNFLAFSVADRWVRYHGFDAELRVALGTVIPTAWTLQNVTSAVPANVSAAFELHWRFHADDTDLFFARSDGAVTALPTSVGDDPLHTHASLPDVLHSFTSRSGQVPTGDNAQFVMLSQNRATPGFRWGLTENGAAASIVHVNEGVVRAYLDTLMATIT